MKFLIQPIECGADVVPFSAAVIVLSLAQASAAEVEAKNRKTKMIQGFHGVEHDFVMQRSAVDRMRMADQCSVFGVAGSFI